MNKRALTFSVFALALILLTGCATETAKPESTLKVGHLAVLSGENEYRGQSEKEALQLLVRRINQNGGLAGRTLQLISIDVETEPVRIVERVKNLVSRDKVVAIIGPAQPAAATTAALVAEQEKIPLLLTTAGRPGLLDSVTGNKPPQFTFFAGLPENYQGRLAAEFLKRTGRVQTAAILADQASELSQSLAEAFAARWIALGGKLVVRENFSFQVVDFRLILERIAEEKPTAVFMPVGYKTAALIAKQARDMAFAPWLVGGADWQHAQFLSLGGKAVEGVFFITQTDWNDPVMQDWSTQYQSTTGRLPVLPESQFAVTALRMIEKAIQKGQSAEPAKIAEQLRLQTDEQRCLKEKLAVVMEIQNGKTLPKLRLAGNSF